MRRRGFILGAVLFALVLLLAVASAAFFAAWQEVRVGRNAAAHQLLRGAAEAALWRGVVAWDVRELPAAGAPWRRSVAAPPGLTAWLEARRLGDRLLLLRAGASDPAGGAQTVQLVMRLGFPEMVPPSAVRTRSIDAAIAARADGSDRAPPGWSCASPGPAVSAVVLQPSASDSAFFQFGPMDWSQLVQWAQAVPNGGDSVGVHYIAGDTILTASRSTGLLVVAGDLVLRGGAELVGMAVVHGKLRFDSGGGAVFGTVIASQVVVEPYVMPLSVTLGYSSCSAMVAAVSRAAPYALRSSPVYPVF